MTASQHEEVRPREGGFDDQCFFGLAAFLASPQVKPVLHIAVVGKDKATILEGFRACPGTHVVLLHTRAEASRARKLRDTLCSGGIPARTHRVPDDPYSGVLREVSAVLHEARVEYSDVYLNVSSGTPAAGCALTTAAYLHGAKAFHLVGDTAVLLPILPYDQRESLGPAKIAILRALAASPQQEETARSIASTGLAPREIRHHLDGEPGRKGLVALGLVEERRRFGVRRILRLSGSGAALLQSGLIAPPPETAQL